jgi:hypothetical protein
MSADVISFPVMDFPIASSRKPTSTRYTVTPSAISR